LPYGFLTTDTVNEVFARRDVDAEQLARVRLNDDNEDIAGSGAGDVQPPVIVDCEPCRGRSLVGTAG
jgi:hypothetical protein